MSFVEEKECFGTIFTHVSHIEFQKRALPHAHCIFFLKIVSKQRLQNPFRIEEVISAEIPSVADRELGEVVLNEANHNICGSHNPEAVSREQGTFRKKFPK